MENKSYINLK